ncbi:MAG TPA: M23 family metallopeptidase [Candidatus Saccharimonadales bacterium]|nr:M23 family metallopeptidase [Candidatus Saccharimonadales bacterium]
MHKRRWKRPSQKAYIVGGIILVLGMAGLGTAYAFVHKSSTPQPTIQPSRSSSTSVTPAPAPTATTPTPAPQPAPELAEPIAQFKARITKKMFGTYVTPQNSPVQPERFQGYHNGVDVEYGDVTGDVPVYAITAGTVTYANWVSGYGGVIVVRYQISGAPHLVLYGHLNVASLAAVGAQVTRGQQIGKLGVAYSHETDGERRHLHFAVLAGTTLDLRGYVQAKSQLSGWIDPLTLPF